jgi:hypothetical protein
VIRWGWVATLGSIAVLAACGGTVVFEESSGGDGGSGAGSTSVSTSTSEDAGSTLAGPNGPAGPSGPSGPGPGGVGGADVGPSSVATVTTGADPLCDELSELTQQYCYTVEKCPGGVFESECSQEGTNQGECHCFVDTAFVGTCNTGDGLCGRENCCGTLFPPAS